MIHLTSHAYNFIDNRHTLANSFKFALCNMSIEQLNLDAFYLLNAPDHASNLMVFFGCFVAHDLIYLLMLLFALAWFIGNIETKTSIVKATIFTAITLCISEVLSALLHTPRPFVMEVGHTLIQHDATGSFPSNHMSILSGIAFSYYFSLKRDLGRVLIWVAIIVAWSRVYVGVHFPIDMVGAFLIALVVNLSGLALWWKYQNAIMRLILNMYNFLMKPFIQQGWIK